MKKMKLLKSSRDDGKGLMKTKFLIVPFKNIVEKDDIKKMTIEDK